MWAGGAENQSGEEDEGTSWFGSREQSGWAKGMDALGMNGRS